MTIDTEIENITEYNENVVDSNTKIQELYTLVDNTLSVPENDGKILIKYGGSWGCVDTGIYNSIYQDLGDVSGSVDLNLNDHSSISAIKITLTGETIINGFGVNFLSGVVYTAFIVQNSMGGNSLRWPTGSSVLGTILEGPHDITVSMIVKLPSGGVFVKNQAYTENTGIGYYE